VQDQDVAPPPPDHPTHRPSRHRTYQPPGSPSRGH
jgi:hypothetical protein